MIPVDHLVTCGAKAALVTASGITGITLATAGASEDMQIFGVELGVIRELGSFGLIAVFVLGILWVIKRIIEVAVPKLMEFLEATTEKFVCELKQEREARERSLIDFREMLQSHKSVLGAKMDDVKDSIDAGNKISQELVTQLGGRPCQIKRP